MSNNTKVLYIVSKKASTSVPLEISKYISDFVLLSVACFYRENASDSTNEDFCKDVFSLEANGFFSVRAVIRMFRLMISFKPDVVHVHHGLSAIIASLFGKLLGVKVLKTEHGAHKYNSFSLRLLSYAQFILSDLVVCNSNSTYDSFTALAKKLLRGKCEVVYNGVDVSRVDAASENRLSLSPEPSPFVIVCVARLIPIKNIESIIEAIYLYKSDKVILKVIGGGPELQSLKELVKERQINSSVEFMGMVGRDDVYRILSESDIMIMPSLSEGFCNAVVEAMVAGLPIVCSDIPTLKEVVGENGYFFDPLSPSSIVEKLDVALEDKGSSQVGELLRQRALENFSMDVAVQKYISLYERLRTDEH